MTTAPPKKKLVSLSIRITPPMWDDLRRARDRLNRLREVGSPHYTITDVVARFIGEGITGMTVVEKKGKL